MEIEVFLCTLENTKDLIQIQFVYICIKVSLASYKVFGQCFITVKKYTNISMIHVQKWFPVRLVESPLSHM